MLSRLVLAVALATAGAAGAGAAGVAPFTGFLEKVENATGGVNVSDGAGAIMGEPVNETAVAHAVHDRINAERSNRSLPPLAHDPHLAAIAAGHSEDMAARGYYSHEDPAGNNFRDRYAEAGYGCRRGAENILKTYYEVEVTGPTGRKEFYNTNVELAEGIVSEWLNSPEHRKVMLDPRYSVEGIGVATAEVDGRTVVYATANYC